MSYDYQSSIATTKRLLSYFGQTGTLRHENVDYPVTFAVTDYTLRELGNGMIVAGDRRVYMEATGFQPIPNEDLLFVGGVAYKIVPPVRKLDPAGTVVYYELQVRR